MSLHTTIIGVLNVTPDSFSDGGRYETVDAAVEHGRALAAAGADIVDVGGESTRPGAERVPADREQARVLPVIRELVAGGVTVSIDTMNAATALASAEAGAGYLNDVSGGLADPRMAEVARETDLPYIVMHWRGHSTDMDALATYGDAVTDIRRELETRVSALLASGVKAERLILDPGLGFAKRREHDWQILNRLSEFTDAGYPVLIGPSRKRFLAGLPTPRALAERDGSRQSAPVQAALDGATAVVSALAVRAGVWGVRVHDVAGTRVALEAAECWAAGRPPDEERS